jgi:poly-gamma-glutamate system protein
MKKREGKISILSLSIVTLITIMLMILELNSKTRVEAKHHKEKLDAATLAQTAFAAVKKNVFEMGIPIDRINDPNETGLIGLQYSPITTERGDLDSKLTSTNPNFAALVVQLLKQAGVRKNDTVAVLQTGSYPALNITVMSAIKTLELQPIIITSVSASMWGANFPQLTYLDMEELFRTHAIFKYKSTAASLGGEDDVGRGLSPAGREIIEEATVRNGVPLLTASNLDEMIVKKMAAYASHGRIRVFINAGERTTALAGLEADNGLIRPHSIKAGAGLIAQFSKKGIPVINLTDVELLAQENDLPIAPLPLPNPGEGRLYYEYRYSVPMAIIAVMILVAILFVVLRFDIDYYLKRSRYD